MSTQRKQYADLIRHRELNALRRLMANRHQPLSFLRTEPPEQSITLAAPDQTLERINELEAQMEGHILQRSLQEDFQATTMSAPQTLQSQLPPITQPEQAVIHEAAAHFAQNNAALAQQLLERAVAKQGEQSGHVPTWLTLLDLYRATDQSALFDSATLDFSVRFGRSTPSWVSIPRLAEMAAKAIEPQSTLGVECQWIAPTYLTAQAIDKLTAAITQALADKRALMLDWRGIISVDPTVWVALKEAFEQLASSKLRCTAFGFDLIAPVFGNAPAEAVLAKLQYLRCQNEAQAYEDAALDYCVAYEISPPDWKAPVCKLDALEHMFDAPPSPDAASIQQSSAADISAPELYGEMSGNLPVAFKAQIEHAALQSTQIVVHCDRLVRCDAQATLQLLQTIQELAQRGITLELKSTHRLQAAYFLSQGLFEYAKVSLRKD